MVKRKGGLWDYVETENHGLNCVFCGFVFGRPVSISKIKAHLHMCRNVPSHVKATTGEASQSGNKRLKTIPSSSNENENENGEIEHIEKLKNEAEKLKNERSSPYSEPLKEILSSAVDGYQALDSRESKLKEVMDALRDPNVNMIGLHGMGGIGKTTLAKQIAKRSIEEKLCDVVIMVTVSMTPEIKEIQGKIADILRFTFNQETQSGRANLLQQRLTEEMKRRNILIILDDLWAILKLEEVGIPFGNDSKACKILLTSRNLHVLSNEMGTQNVVQLEELSEEEALTLFEKTIGGDKSLELLPKAAKVVKKCAGLPILIVTVASSLKNKPIHVWRNTLKQLSRFDNEGIQAKTHSILKFSYDRLKGGVQPFFLLCGLLGNSHISILDLLKYSMGLGLFKGISTVEEARDQVLTFIDQLKDSCLLQDGDTNGFVRMHEVVQEVAVSIASDDQHAVTSKDVIGSQGWPKDRLKKATRISLPYCDIHDIPDEMKCPKVELFLLSTRNRLLKTPDQLFERFEELKVLSLGGMHFPSLPPSLGGLRNLQTLCLNDCMLSDIAIVAALKTLEILSFRGSNIVKLPREIEQLTQLKLLDLSNCFYLQVIPAKVISKLTLLEELYIHRSFNRWEVAGFNNQSYASLAELEHLSLLSVLEIHVPDVKTLPKYSLSKELERYKISIGSWRSCRYWHKMETSRDLDLSSSIFSVNGVKVLLKGTETYLCVT